MIALLGASALALAGLQASIATPTTAFRGCLREAVNKANGEKVGPDTIETYLRGACTVQMSTLRNVLVEFRLKNGMGKKQAAADAQMTIDDYVSTPADNYKYAASKSAKDDSETAAPAPAQQASSQTHK